MSLFRGLTFHLDEDVNDEIRLIIQKEGGSFWDEEETPLVQFMNGFVFLVNQLFLRENKVNPRKPRFYRVVMHQWVNMCVLNGRRLGMEPFLLSKPEAETNLPGGSAAKHQHFSYTKEEEDLMWEFAEAHSEMTQHNLWTLAEEEGLLQGRTARGMLLHFTGLKQRRDPLDRTNRRYTTVDDDDIITWSFCWDTFTLKEPTSNTKWKHAEEHFIVHGRTETQMAARFKRICTKNPMWKERAKGLVNTQHWLSLFNIPQLQPSHGF